MKKEKAQTIVRFVMLCLIVFVFFSSCESEQDFNEETTTFSYQTQRQTSVISFDKLPFQFMKSVDLLDETVRSNSRSAEDLLVIDQSQIIEVIDSLSNSKFSILFRLPDQPANVLYNLILGNNADGSDIDPFVLKYSASNLEQVYSEGYFDVSKMRGTISEYRLDSFLAYVDSQLDRTTDDIAPDPCARYTNENNDTPNEDDDEPTDTSNSDSGGGGGATGNGDDNTGIPTNDDSVGGNGEFENTDDEDDTNDCSNIWIWSNGTTGEVIGISWTCTDGSSGYGDVGRTVDPEECPGKGDVGVNTDFPYVNCASFEYANRDGIKGAHTLGVTDVFIISRVSASGTIEFIAVNITFPSLFFTMPASWTNGFAANRTALAMDNSIEITKAYLKDYPNTPEQSVGQIWLQFLRFELAKGGGTVGTTPLFYVRSPAPYSTSLIPTNCM